MKQYLLPALAGGTLLLCRLSQAEETGHSMLPPGSVGTDKPNGRTLFLKNCAHCHGADARGDDGPDLHALDWTDEQIAKRIRNGKPGQMTAFAGKLTAEQIAQLVGYVQGLK